jgi:hypothetical protein
MQVYIWKNRLANETRRFIEMHRDDEEPAPFPFFPVASEHELPSNFQE